MINSISSLVQEIGILASVIVALFGACWWILTKKEAATREENIMAQEERNSLNERIDNIVLSSQRALQEQHKICTEEISELRKLHSSEITEIRQHNSRLQSKLQDHIVEITKDGHALQRDYMLQMKAMSDATNVALSELTRAIDRVIDNGKG